MNGIEPSDKVTVEIKYAGTLGATFATSGLNLESGDTYQIGGTAVLAATGAAALQTSAVTGLSALSSGQVQSDTDVLLIYDNKNFIYIFFLIFQINIFQIIRKSRKN